MKDDEFFLASQEELNYAESESGEELLDADGEGGWERSFEEGERRANDEMVDEWNLQDY